MTGSLAPGESRRYVLGAADGQNLYVRVATQAPGMYYQVFNEVPDFSGGVLPSFVTEPSKSVEDDEKNLIRLQKGSEKGFIYTNLAGKSLTYIYLISGTQAQSLNRISNLPDICRTVFVDQQTQSFLGTTVSVQ